jgi:hypothetical protein
MNIDIEKELAKAFKITKTSKSKKQTTRRNYPNESSFINLSATNTREKPQSGYPSGSGANKFMPQMDNDMKEYTKNLQALKRNQQFRLIKLVDSSTPVNLKF